VEGFHIDEATERDDISLFLAVRLRPCDAKDSCGTVYPAL